MLTGLWYSVFRSNLIMLVYYAFHYRALHTMYILYSLDYQSPARMTVVMSIYLVLANDEFFNHFAYYFPMFLHSMLRSTKVLCTRSNCASRDHGHSMETYPATGCCIVSTGSQRVSSLAWFPRRQMPTCM